MKNYLILFIAIIFVGDVLNAQILITEIMYNSPDESDDYEYLELYNSSGADIQMKDYEFTSGIVYKFEDFIFNASSYILIVKDSATIRDFGVEGIVWTSGGLKNSGETIALSDPNGIVINSVDFDDSDPWATESDGDGPSLELCDINKDNSDPNNWKPSTNLIGIQIEGIDVLGTPGQPNSASCGLPTPDHIVIASGLSFSPQDITVKIGDIVQWENQGGNHNVNGTVDQFPNNPEGFNSGVASSDSWIYQFTFTVPGIYNYQCDPHADLGMTGTVTVLEKEKPSLVISEIMYNDGGANDSLEFIEIYNQGADTVFMEGIQLITKTINFSFPNYFLKSNDYVVVCKDTVAFKKYFGYYPLYWGQGGLNNKSDSIMLFNGEQLDFVEYFDSGDWPELADGQGYSLSLCNLNSDNNVGNNWQASPVYAGFKYMGNEIHANPGSKNYCSFDIDYLQEVDTMGEIIHSDINPFLAGTVYGINYNSDGLQFVLMDDNNHGIWIYEYDKNYGYTVHEGDKIHLWGKMDQFNGLTQINLDSVLVVRVDSVIEDPIVINNMNENTEGQLVKINDVHLLDHTKWSNSGQGFNVQVANVTDTFDLRIDKDTDIFGQPHPVGIFSVTGLCGQYDKTKPLFEGYQLLPRYVEDINPFNAEQYPFKPIGEVTEIDSQGKGVSVGLKYELRGVVYGINLRPTGLQFTLIDQLNDGIGVFNYEGNLDYIVKEGDYISVKGTIDQYNGLLQINPIEIVKISSDNGLYLPITTIELNEESESQLIKINNVYLKDVTEWKGDGTGFNVTVTNGTDEYLMRIDNDLDLSTVEAPDYNFNLTGIGGQYDETSPFTDGYQISPRYALDIEKISSTFDISNDEIVLYPNPTKDYLNLIKKDIRIYSIKVFSNIGKKVYESNDTEILNISNLNSGMYKALINTNKGVFTKAFIKAK